MPYGIAARARQVASWNGVPSGASARSNVRRSPAKYSRELVGERAEGGRVAPPGGVGPPRGGPGLEVDQPEPGVVGRDQQRPDRRLDLVVAHRHSPVWRREARLGDAAAAPQRWNTA